MTTTNLEFCTLGMFIVDEIEYTDGKARAESIIGGAGTYAAIGARLVAGIENAKKVGWIVDVGSDFPEGFRTLIDSWQTNCTFRNDERRLTTRAWNGYRPDEYRAFKYLTPKLRLDENSLSEAQLMSNNFHFVCSSQRCISLVEGILSRRQRLAHRDGFNIRPHFVWEPVPELCNPSQLELFQKAVGHVDIVSPNAEEFAAFFKSGLPPRSQGDLASQAVAWKIGPDGGGVLVIREGNRGCSAYSRSWQCHLPAFYQQTESSAVADPTGGGNAFLGALAMALGGKVQPSFTAVETQLKAFPVTEGSNPLGCLKMVVVLVFATVAASYAIQQTGMPLLSCNERVVGGWNGELFGDRLARYVRRERDHIKNSVHQERIGPEN